MQSKLSSLPLLVPVSYSGRTDHHYDLRAFLHKGGASLSPNNSLSDEARASMGPIIIDRIPLINRIHRNLLDSKTDGLALRSMGRHIEILRAFIKYCDTHEFSISLNLQELRTNSKKWVEHNWQRIRVHEIKESTGSYYCWGVVNVLTSALGCSEYELIQGITMPRPKDKQPLGDKLDLSKVDDFIGALRRVTNALTLNNVFGPWPIPIEVQSGQIVYYNGQGNAPKGGNSWILNRPSHVKKREVRNADLSFKSRRRVIGLRVQSEVLLFIAITGMNLQPTLDLEVGDLTYHSFKDEYEVIGFKNRRGSIVRFRIPKFYRVEFEAWLAFRQVAFAELGTDLLFPLTDKGAVANHTIGESGFLSLQRIMKEAGIQRFPARDLRLAKAQRLIRLDAIGEDLNKVANELQNSLPVLLRSYAKGSQQRASVELNRFFKTVASKTKINRVQIGGHCNRPSSPEPISSQEMGPVPDCTNPASCLFCNKFRAIESYDFVHALLSFEVFLRLRSGTSWKDAQSWEKLYFPIVERLENFIKVIEDKSLKLSEAVVEARQAISEHDYHISWKGWIELLHGEFN